MILIGCYFFITTVWKLVEKKQKGGIETLVGNTPMIRIKSLSEMTGCEILAKVEFMNVGGSSKDRLALEIVNFLESQGIKEACLFEGTVGSTGISLATVCKAKGYKCWIVMPDDQAKEKYELLERLGATVERVRPCSIVDPNHFVNVAKRRAQEMNESGKHGYFVNQFENLLNFEAHYKTTGPEIYQQTGGRIDAFVMGCGTGGTMSGVAHYLQERTHCKFVLADPQGSGLYNKVKHGVMFSNEEREGTRKRHQVDTVVEGVGINRLTNNFNTCLNLINEAVKVTDQEAVSMSRHLLNQDGIFVGSSSSVNCFAALKTAIKLGPGHTIVTLLCDHGSRHLTKFWSTEYLLKEGLDPDLPL
ncbi:tryptophan synthase beta subunit-like PLP-dependent enzyme [Gorgonomyces haynaldii]|nr:tryptophan synthase beta subunit-like PLP-dependent enzyme [Gorgonomyces haynaldii]